jgi:hypothetical protein
MVAMGLLCVVLTGCGPQDPASPGPTGGGSSAAATTPATLEKLAGQGIGSYVVGADLAALTSAGSLTNVKTSDGCPDFTTADATGPYFGTVTIVFFQNKVSWISVSSAVVSTMDGAAVGQKLTAVKSLYGARANQLDDGHGGQALGVREGGGTGLLFRAAADGTVASIDAGTYDTLEFRFVEGEGC